MEKPKRPFVASKVFLLNKVLVRDKVSVLAFACLVFAFLGVNLSVAAVLLRSYGRPKPVGALPSKRLVNQFVMAPPANTARANRTGPKGPLTIAPLTIVPLDIRNSREAARASRSLNAICDTGASENAIATLHGLVARIDAHAQPSAKGLSATLTRVLAFREGGGSDYQGSDETRDNYASRERSSYSASDPVSDSASLSSAGSSVAFIPGFPGLPTDLIDRAAAACDARSHRKPGQIVLSFAGDCTLGTVNGDDGPSRFPAVYRRSHQRDYPFALLQPWFLNDDLTVVNFEGTLTNAARTADKQWHFKGAAQYASIFAAGSVEAVGLANNHSFDYRQPGFQDTVANFRKAHVPAFYQNTPYITHLQGVETVLIGDCTVVGENTTTIDGAPDRVLGEIQRYKKPGNLVIVVMHWGSELDPFPRRWQQKLGRQFIDAGADAVVGHHPHVVQGIERYRGRYIAYSLGNFAFGGNSHARFPETFVLRLRFDIVAGKTRTLAASIVPC